MADEKPASPYLEEMRIALDRFRSQGEPINDDRALDFIDDFVTRARKQLRRVESNQSISSQALALYELIVDAYDSAASMTQGRTAMEFTEQAKYWRLVLEQKQSGPQETLPVIRSRFEVPPPTPADPRAAKRADPKFSTARRSIDRTTNNRKQIKRERERRKDGRPILTDDDRTG